MVTVHGGNGPVFYTTNPEANHSILGSNQEERKQNAVRELRYMAARIHHGNCGAPSHPLEGMEADRLLAALSFVDKELTKVVP